MPEKAVNILNQAGRALESRDLRRLEPVQMLLVLPLRALELRQHLFSCLRREAVRLQPPDEFVLTNDNRRAVADMPPDHFDFRLAFTHRSPLGSCRRSERPSTKHTPAPDPLRERAASNVSDEHQQMTPPFLFNPAIRRRQ